MEITTPSGEKRNLTTWYKSGEREIKTVAIQIPKGAINEEKRTIFAVASGGEVDRDEEILDPKGWNWKNFIKNPVLLWAHNYSELPIGSVKWIRSNKEKTLIKFEAHIHDVTPLSNYVWELFKKGVIRAFSVGFLPNPKKWEYPEDKDSDIWRISHEHELLEISAVPVPAYPGALLIDENEALKASIREEIKKTTDPKFAKELDRACNLTVSECGIWTCESKEPDQTVEETMPPEADPWNDPIDILQLIRDLENEDAEIEVITGLIEGIIGNMDEGIQAKARELVSKLKSKFDPPEAPKQRVRLVRKEAPKQKMSREEVDTLVKQQINNAGVGDIIKDAVKNHLNLIRGRVI